jgi:GNAT superfamily N-acetyltransferase
MPDVQSVSPATRKRTSRSLAEYVVTLAYAVERFDDALPDIEKLIPAHWAEVGSFKDEFARQIDYWEYRRIEDAGKLMVVTARHAETKELAAYYVGILGNDSHRVTRTNPPMHVGIASARVYYVRPEYRGYARGFIRAIEREAAARGCSISSIRVKRGMNRADEFLAAIGYTETETTYSRLIGDAADASRTPPKAP